MRLLNALLRLYPRTFRERFGDELRELVQARQGQWSLFALAWDLLAGAARAHGRLAQTPVLAGVGGALVWQAVIWQGGKLLAWWHLLFLAWLSLIMGALHLPIIQAPWLGFALALIGAIILLQQFLAHFSQTAQRLGSHAWLIGLWLASIVFLSLMAYEQMRFVLVHDLARLPSAWATHSGYALVSGQGLLPGMLAPTLVWAAILAFLGAHGQRALSGWAILGLGLTGTGLIALTSTWPTGLALIGSLGLMWLARMPRYRHWLMAIVSSLFMACLQAFFVPGQDLRHPEGAVRTIAEQQHASLQQFARDYDRAAFWQRQARLDAQRAQWHARRPWFTPLTGAALTAGVSLQTWCFATVGKEGVNCLLADAHTRVQDAQAGEAALTPLRALPRAP